MIKEWLVSMVCLLFLIVVYSIMTPILNILVLIFSENGAPLAPILWIRFNYIWGFIIFGALCLAYPFLSGYRRTYDTGIDNTGRWM